MDGISLYQNYEDRFSDRLIRDEAVWEKESPSLRPHPGNEAELIDVRMTK
jgi:hypothetical protein